MYCACWRWGELDFSVYRLVLGGFTYDEDDLFCSAQFVGRRHRGGFLIRGGIDRRERLVPLHRWVYSAVHGDLHKGSLGSPFVFKHFPWGWSCFVPFDSSGKP